MTIASNISEALKKSEIIPDGKCEIKNVGGLFGFSSSFDGRGFGNF